jgi:hypothetical protein
MGSLDGGLTTFRLKGADDQFFLRRGLQLRGAWVEVQEQSQYPLEYTLSRNTS